MVKTSTLLALGFLFNLSVFAQNTIPNPGFETWAGGDPTGWNTLNPLTGILSVYTATQDTVGAQVHSGTSSIKLVTTRIVAVNRTAPALVTTGVINSNNNTINGGIPINARVISVNGWYLYTPAGVDSASFQILLTKWNAAGDSTEIVGRGISYATDTTTTWAQFSTTVNYLTSDVPDTVQLLFLSSQNITPQIGSTLILDDISYTLPSGINEVAQNTFSVYPNPAGQSFYFNNETIKARSIRVLSADGRLAAAYNLEAGINSLNTSGLSSGLYLISAMGADGSLHHSTVVIQK
jgi:Secretion system C-terminal sorting domain